MGPYDSEQQAQHDVPGRGLLTGRDDTRRHLLATLAKAGVELGRFDEQIVNWLVSLEPTTVQAVVGWVVRAYAAGRDNR